MAGMNMQQMMKQARKMQEQLAAAQENLKSQTVDASAGGGMVKVTVNGEMELVNLTIDPDALDPEDVDMLQDMIMAAVNEAVRGVNELANKQMAPSPAASTSRACRSKTHIYMSANHSLQKLLDELGRLPGIGPKSAQRIAYYLLEADAEEARRLAEAILEVKQEVHFCSRCFNYATADECSICQDPMRDTTRICVVGEPRDVQAIERTGSYHGLYHVLGGVISPMDKIGPEQLHIRELLARLGHEDIHEVIIATNPNIEGETTASYLARTIKPLGVEVSRLASGLPVGGDLEYADELTLGRAIEARRAI